MKITEWVFNIRVAYYQYYIYLKKLLAFNSNNVSELKLINIKAIALYRLHCSQKRRVVNFLSPEFIAQVKEAPSVMEIEINLPQMLRVIGSP